MPLAESSVPDKSCTERTIGIFEDKIDLITCTLAISQRLRKTPAEYVNPVGNIALAHVVITDYGHRFVLRLASLGVWRSPLVNSKELVVENPFGLNGVHSGSTHQRPVHRPMTNHFIKQRVGKYRVGTIDWPLAGLPTCENEHHKSPPHP